MVSNRLPCGHNVGWIIRLRDEKRLYKYCWGCVIENSGTKEVFPQVNAEPPKEIKKPSKKTV